MSLQGLFGIVDYILYLVQSTNRHGVHSPFVYHFTDAVLYDKSPCLFEPAAELCRKRMIQSKRRISLDGQELSLSKIALNHILSAKYNRLLFRWIQDQQLGNYIVEIGSSLGVSPLYLQRGNVGIPRYFLFDKHKSQLKISEFNLQEYGCQESIQMFHYQEVDEIIVQLERQPDAPIDLFIINQLLSAESFWKLIDWVIPRLGDKGCIVVTTMRHSTDQQLLWQQLQNQTEITVAIDLFAMGMAFARSSQVKENFLLRY